MLYLYSYTIDHETATMIMNYCSYCFGALRKVKIKYVILCSNPFAKLQNARGTSRHPVLMDNCPTCKNMARPYRSTEWFFISLCLGVCRV